MPAESDACSAVALHGNHNLHPGHATPADLARRMTWTFQALLLLYSHHVIRRRSLKNDAGCRSPSAQHQLTSTTPSLNRKTVSVTQ